MQSLILCLGILLFGLQASALTYFTKDEIESKEYVRIKSAEWAACRQETARLFYISGADNPLSEFLETNQIVSNLGEMEDLQLTRATVKVQPWSGDYWAYASGLLAARLFNSDFGNLSDWKERFDYVQGNSANSVLINQGQTGVESLSVSEKYDLLTGNLSMALTGSMWAQGKQYFDKFGKVESWMGICHGWSAASIMESRPEKAVDVESLDQKWKMRFVPSEIKGIVSYSWASNPYPVVTVGERCTIKEPSRDENGRLTDPACFDLNPSTWHKAIVNQVGVAHQSFVMDATYDYEVWNYPVRSYSYTYFNVATEEAAENFKAAAIPISEFKNDPYKKYRSPDVVSVVGISMNVSYTVETMANQQETDSPNEDIESNSNYKYDLELDGNGNIIGGEWHQTVHPDFIWKPLKDAVPNSYLDSRLQVTDWSGSGPIPPSWVNAAHLSSPWGVVLNTVSKALLQKAATEVEQE